MNFSSLIGILRIVGFTEGISFLCFLVTMPLKYIFEIPGPNKVVGMLHGVLFIAYIFLVFWTNKEVKWNLKNQFILYAASLIPIGTFITDKRILVPAQMNDEKRN